MLPAVLNSPRPASEGTPLYVHETVEKNTNGIFTKTIYTSKNPGGNVKCLYELLIKKCLLRLED